MAATSSTLLLHILLVFSLATAIISSATKVDGVECIEREGRALLEFKENVIDDDGHLSSWRSHHGKVRDCCQWDHVYCSNVTHHVIGLDLRAPCSFYNYPHITGNLIPHITGNLSSSLLVLEHLVYLDLSGNDFVGGTIPSFIGGLHKLMYLSLACTNFSGEVPYQLKNLSRLQHLDLSFNEGLSTKDPMAWLSSLYSLRYVALNSTDLSQATCWTNAICNLPYLRYLDLSGSNLLDETPSSLILTNLSKSLSYVDLSFNKLSGRAIYPWLFNFSSSLVEIGLSANLIGGRLPETFGTMVSLSHLDLSYNQLRGPIPEAFGTMVSLSHLDLSNNQLRGPIPEAFGTMVSLSHLNLSYNQLRGPIPDSIGNLSHLLDLFLTDNQLDSGIPTSFQHLCQLQKVDISSNSLSQDLPDLFKSFSGCPEKSLVYLQLDSNYLTGSLPDFTTFSSLNLLDLSSNKLNGTFPTSFQQISPLNSLVLSDNQLTGSLPDLSVFWSLSVLWLDSNRLNGTISEGIGKLSMLTYLVLSSNSLKCRIIEAHLSNLSSLEFLDLSNNSMVFDISANWTPPFRLVTVALSYNKLGPHFPRWLQSWGGSLSTLDISNNGISDSIPAWFWNVSVGASNLFLQQNSIHGTLPDSPVKFQNFPFIDLSYNCLEGPIPSVFATASHLILSNNKLSGSFATFLCEVDEMIDISHNFISGELPDCWKPKTRFSLLLSNNLLSGKIPASLGFVENLLVLKLSNNRFHGNLPSSLKRCRGLSHLEVGNNSLSGEIPPWIGTRMWNLFLLSLRNNLFTGIIPPQLCYLSSLQILDLSSNNISGTIPHCLSNLSAMTAPLSLAIHLPQDSGSDPVYDLPSFVWKGSELEYNNCYAEVSIIDLSSNKLEGEIPSELSSLAGLKSLNLSRNQLKGPLSAKLGRLKSLESLDLSRNILSGEIPRSFSTMNSLGKLDLSDNNLSGRIPSGTQLQTFDAASYGNNPRLCGPPLTRTCPGDDVPEKGRDQNDSAHGEEADSSTGLYVSVGLGFATGFWGICGALIFNRNLRYAYFRFLAHIYDRLFVLIMVTFRGWGR